MQFKHKTIPWDNRLFLNYTKWGFFYSKVCRGTTKYIFRFMRFYNASCFRIKSTHFRIKADQTLALNGIFVLYNFINE